MSRPIYDSEPIEVDITDGRMLNIHITNEGVIMDVFGTDYFEDGDGLRLGERHLGTAAMTFEEWADWVQTRIGESVL